MLRKSLSLAIALALPAIISTTASAAVVNVAGNYDDPNTTIGVGNIANMTADTIFGWKTGTNCALPVITNGFTFTLNTGSGNRSVLAGTISGSGNVVLIGRNASDPAYWDLRDLWLSSTSGNTYTGSTTLSQGSLHLTGADGVTQVPGDLSISPVDTFSQVIWQASNQIDDISNITVNATRSHTLNLGGFSDTVASLTAGANLVVDTGTGGVLSVSSLTIGGSSWAPGVYTSANSDGIVLGTGSINVVGGTAVPEPASVGLLLLGGMGLLTRRRQANA
jgi:autotransporter-associated beta strand protein